MASQLIRQFDYELYNLLDDRTHSLRSIIRPIPGPGPKVTNSKVLKISDRLADLAEQELLRTRTIRDLLKGYDYKRQWHPKRGKGWGKRAKKRNFKAWYDRYITTKSCVYVFWNHRRCLYVGRTLNGKGRPAAHFDKFWFNHATRVDIYGFDRKRNVPRFECLLTHKHEPTYSHHTPAAKKHQSRCNICVARAEVRSETKHLFRIR